MGLFISNIHIKKNEHFNITLLIEMLKQQMVEKGYSESQNADDAEIAVSIYSSDESNWVTVASDCFNFNNADSTKAATTPFSEKFETDVIAATCVDSDFVMMNLINSKRNLDGWINVGEFYGPKPRRASIAPWKNVVSDYEKFYNIVKSNYTFAEDVLYKSAEYFGMSSEQCALQPDDNSLSDNEHIITLYFSSPIIAEKKSPKLEISKFNLTPCQFGRNQVVFVNNKGGRSNGVAVIFWGNFVENDDLIIENATFESDYGSDKRKVVPITLQKLKSAAGDWILYWEDRNFNIPHAVNQSLPYSKLSELEFEKVFGVRFYVSGNPRKLLDVKVSIIPLENYQHGSDTWFVYRYKKTKRAYIESHNQGWKEKGFDNLMINPDDFDLD